MIRLTSLVTVGLLFVLAAGNLAQARKIHLEVTVREQNADSEYVLIAQKPLSLTENVKQTCFMVNFTLDISASFDDTSGYDCEFSLFTLGPQTQTVFKTFHSLPGGIYFINSIRDKHGRFYRIGISPLSVDSAAGAGGDCDFDYRGDGVWSFDPSANFDLYFVPQSLGDARWNLLRDYLEINNKQFKQKFELSFPGKVNCFFAPCILPALDWDMRGGFAIDPTRANCFLLYSHDHNTVDPLPAYLTRIYRFMGYAPPLLAEGWAAYFELPHYYAKELKKTSQLPPLSLILKSVDYYTLPEYNNMSTAASFIKYMIDTYGYSRFTRWYGLATDLTLADDCADVYGKSLGELESEWLTLLDTLTIERGNYRFNYERYEYIYNKPGMERFLQEMKNTTQNHNDSVYVFSKEAWDRYMDGDFEAARGLYEMLMDLDSANSTNPLVYANLLLIDGQYDSALVMYDFVLRQDSTIKTVYNKQGDTWLRKGEVDSARAYLMKDLTEDPSQLSQASSGIILGSLALAAGDTTTARDYYADAVAAMQQIYQLGKARPSYLLRLGQAHMGLALCDGEPLTTAKSFLDQAYYFEVHPTRVIFITRILKELGRIADLEGRRDDAIGYYQQVLTYPVPPHIEAEVRGYIVTPFGGFTPTTADF